MLLSKCSGCNSKKLKFLREQEARGLLSNLTGVKIPILSDLLLIIKMHLKQPGFTYSACGPFTKKKEIIKKFNETGDSRYIYQKGLDKACFQRDMAYGDFIDLNRGTDKRL